MTSAGRKRYDVDIETAKERVKSAKKVKTISGSRKKAKDNLAWEKQKLSDEKAKAWLNKETREKSKRRLKLEQMYRDKGMSEEEAEIAAYKRVRTEKILAAIGGTAATAAAAYAVYKYREKNVDKIIKPGTTLQNISNNSNKGVEDAFYFSMNKSDNNKYRGYYGLSLNNRGDVYETKFSVKNGLKVASPKHARQALAEMVENNVNRQMLIARLGDINGRLSPDGNKIVKGAIADLKNGKVTSRAYNALNIALVNNKGLMDTNSVRKNFYTALTNKGYDAIMDIYDKKYSGYMSKRPMIAFNALGKVTVDTSRKLDEIEMMSNAQKALTSDFIKQYATQQIPVNVAYTAGGIGIAALVKNDKRKKRDKIVSNYKKEHPDTNLSYNEIVDLNYR